MPTNGKDEEQQAGEQQPQDAPEPERMAVLGVIAVNPVNGALQLQINQNVVKDKMAFFLAVSQLALGNATSEHHKQNTSKILVPERKVARL